MAMLDDLADALARDVLAAMEELGDDRFFNDVSKVLSSSSPTLQEAFMTAVRVRLGEIRARKFVEQTLAAKRTGSKAPSAPMTSDGGH